MENGQGKRPSYPGNDVLGKLPFQGNERLRELSTIGRGSLPTQGMMNWGTSFPGDGELGNFPFPWNDGRGSLFSQGMMDWGNFPSQGMVSWGTFPSQEMVSCGTFPSYGIMEGEVSLPRE